MEESRSETAIHVKAEDRVLNLPKKTTDTLDPNEKNN